MWCACRRVWNHNHYFFLVALAGCKQERNRRSDEQEYEHSFHKRIWCGFFVETEVTLRIRLELACYSSVYSARSATIGSTRVARRAGTKQDAAATAVSNAATAK